MSRKKHTILIAGTSGVVGAAAVRQHGFPGCEDTDDSLHYWLERMQAERLLPR